MCVTYGLLVTACIIHRLLVYLQLCFCLVLNVYHTYIACHCVVLNTSYIHCLSLCIAPPTHPPPPPPKGPALSLLPLAILGVDADLPIAVGCLSAALACQGFNYAGFHSYVQDVVPSRAGEVLGLTNTSSTLAGMVATLVTGALAGGGGSVGQGGFSLAYLCTSVLYASSFVVWLLVLRGQSLDDAGGEGE